MCHGVHSRDGYLTLGCQHRPAARQLASAAVALAGPAGSAALAARAAELLKSQDLGEGGSVHSPPTPAVSSDFFDF